MEIEYEATFPNISKKEMRTKLKKAGGALVKKEFLQRRVVFNLPKDHEIPGGWLRVRDEQNKITLSLKIVDGSKIENQKELQLTINDFDKAVFLLEAIGCQKKAFQESKREIWNLDGVEVVIDEWPFLEPYLEIEGRSEQEVKDAAKKLGLNYLEALFCSVDKLYSIKYGLSQDRINNHTPEIRFGGKNPFT